MEASHFSKTSKTRTTACNNKPNQTQTPGFAHLYAYSGAIVSVAGDGVCNSFHCSLIQSKQVWVIIMIYQHNLRMQTVASSDY